MQAIKVLLCVFSVGFFSSTLANPESIKASSQPPQAMMHWKSMLGEWSTTEESLQQDGSAWYPSAKADWNFYMAMNGWAIRDEYISPPLSEAIEDESIRQIGTNLRIYNQDKQQWLMVWMTKLGQRIDAYTATSNEQRIVMLSEQKNVQGYFSRITFFDMQENSFEWKMEWSKDREKNWLEVHRIHGTRKNRPKN